MTRFSGFKVPAFVAVASLVLVACGGGSDGGSAPASDVSVVSDSVANTAAADSPFTNPPETEPGVEPRCGVVVDRDDDVDEYESIECATPHDAEFAGLATVAVDAAVDAAVGDDLALTLELLRACAPVVVELTGEPNGGIGVEVGAVHEEGSTGPDNVECWAQTGSPRVLVGSMTELGFRGALGETKVLATDLEPGECFVSFEIGYSLVTSADCDTEGAEQYVATVVVQGDDYPGEDALVEQSFELCDAELATVEFDLISDQYGIVYPDEEGFRAFGQRQVICTMVPSGASSADDEQADDEDIETAGADQPCAADADDSFAVMPCDEPHGAEFAGTVPPPVDVLPEDADEARSIMFAACRPVVEEFTGRDVSEPGIGVGFQVGNGLGEAITEDVPCFVSTNTSDALLGSIAEIGLEAAVQKSIVPELAPGTCFLLGEENFTWADVADCSAPDALMFIGNVQLDDGPYPGDDVIREIRTGLCGDLLSASGLAVDPATVSGTFPGQSDWENLDHRNLACDATPL